jgi:transposase
LRYAKHREPLRTAFPDPSVQRSIDLDLARIEFYDDQLSRLQWYLKRTAKSVDPKTVIRLQSVHGIGDILSLVILYEIHDIERFPRVQDFVSYCRLVKCQRESAGKKHGTGGARIGNPYLPGPSVRRRPCTYGVTRRLSAGLRKRRASTTRPRR